MLGLKLEPLWGSPIDPNGSPSRPTTKKVAKRPTPAVSW